MSTLYYLAKKNDYKKFVENSILATALFDKFALDLAINEIKYSNRYFANLKGSILFEDFCHMNILRTSYSFYFKNMEVQWYLKKNSLKSMMETGEYIILSEYDDVYTFDSLVDKLKDGVHIDE